jgi:ligand-binding SRPBCC domain-containing protein
MAYRQNIHVEAPVEKVFNFFKDPNNWREAEPEGVVFKDVSVTQEGLGTHYIWTAKIAGFTIEGFDVFTEFIPNQRITDMSSSSLEGTWTYAFQPEGSGTKLTVENRVRSFWRIPPLEILLDWVTAKTHNPRFARLKARLEE